MSSVFYKFKIAKDYDTCKFDGTGISVFDLKKDIMITKKLGKGTDFDLVLWNTSSGEEILDDNEIIPKNSSVLVSRRPAQRAGKGTAQKYLGVNPMGFSKNVPTFSKVQPIAYRPKVRPNLAQNANMSEEDKIKMMFKQQSAQWETTANGARPMYRPMGMGRGMPMQQDKTPHVNYVCFRCGEKGHFINQCPTLGNKDYDNRPKLKRTTGIPKMFLKTVESTEGAGLMVTTTGEIVVAQPNEDAWNKMTRTKAVGELDSFSSDLQCSLCDKLFSDPVLVSCCNTAFCRECISFSLLENADISRRFKCPACSQYQSPENLRNAPKIAKAVANALSKSRSGRQMNSTVENSGSPPKTEEASKKRAASPDGDYKAIKSQKLDQ